MRATLVAVSYVLSGTFESVHESGAEYGKISIYVFKERLERLMRKNDECITQAKADSQNSRTIERIKIDKMFLNKKPRFLNIALDLIE